MTPDQITLAQHLVKARFQPGSWDKRFARDMAAWSVQTPDKELSDNQRRTLYQQVIRYRRSLDKVYVKLAKELLAKESSQEIPEQPQGTLEAPRGFEHSNYVSQLGLPG